MTAKLKVSWTRSNWNRVPLYCLLQAPHLNDPALDVTVAADPASCCVTSDATTTAADVGTTSADDEKPDHEQQQQQLQQQQQQQDSVDDDKSQMESVIGSKPQLPDAAAKNSSSCQFPSNIVPMSTVPIPAGM